VSARVTLYGLLAVVAGSAAVLSFDGLRSLAAAAGFGGLSPLLPLVIDCGAAAGSLAWLSRTGRARTFGRVLALVLLTSSVAGNGVSHGLEAYGVKPAWWVVVIVGAVAPAVLGAVVHLAVLVGRPAPMVELLDEDDEPIDWWSNAPRAEQCPDDSTLSVGDRVAELIASGVGRRRLARELRISEHEARGLLAGRRNGHRAVES
jgi:hypothetical protein